MIYQVHTPERKVVDGTTIQVGTPLVDKHGNLIGKIKEIQEKGFVVDRSCYHFDDILIPYCIGNKLSNG